MNVALVGIGEGELDDFLALFDAYRRELDAYSASGPDIASIEEYRAALLRGREAQELLWIAADGDRAGFLLLREFEDWPDASRTVIDIAECYVAPEFRRRGVGRAAIEALLTRERGRGTSLVEASVLRGNDAALAFWKEMGFTEHSIRTARHP